MPTGERRGNRWRLLACAGGLAILAAASAAVDAAPAADSSSLRLRVEHASPKKLYAHSGRRVGFRFELRGRQRRDVTVEAARKGGGVYRRWTLDDVAPGQSKVLSWNGVAADGEPVPNGRYLFRVRGEDGRQADRKRSGGDRRFGVYGHRFPIRGRHSYGDGVGAGRRHRGQDVFARCGRKLRAARGGRVEYRDSQRRGAGHYVVIDGAGVRLDYVYMHLRGPSSVRRGERVRTGEVIGRVGDSGNASGCHLHFELWSAPGWYEGGRHLRSVTRKLRRWDRWS